ncbi:hypothetical protein GZL_00793 [Streptomyces sp. 769]|nr:hypothetical protein GZL_00793 [Streptomyces sp. 769]
MHSPTPPPQARAAGRNGHRPAPGTRRVENGSVTWSHATDRGITSLRRATALSGPSGQCPSPSPVIP